MLKKTKREQWSGQLSFILASTGAAVGLGNIWKFPYMAGSDGGSSFVLIYLLCVLFIGMPIMIAEIVIGRIAQKNPIDALKSISKNNKKSPAWQLIGWWGMFGLILTLSFYCVVAGWAIFYFVEAASGNLQNLNTPEVTAVWQNFLHSPSDLIKYQIIFIILTFVVVAMGVHAGLERAARILMPLLFIVLIFLVIYAGVSMPKDFKHAFHFLFDFRAAEITPNIFIDALGHAFFTLAIGVGAMCAYGSYLPKRVSITYSVFVTAILDVLVAVLSGLAIFPVIFMHHLSPESGPGLMFMTLPVAFSHMDAGRFLESLFFLLLLFAAWTSSINISEPLVSALTEKTFLNRFGASILVALVAFVVGLLSVFSFNIFGHFEFMGRFDLFTVITDLVTNIILPVGGILFCIYAGWVMPKSQTKSALALGRTMYAIWRFLIRYLAPTGILFVFFKAIL
jgi:neurotransmitter:Na+ symporter, NSS family